MADDKKKPKVSDTFTRGSQVPSQSKVPSMPSVKPPATKPSQTTNQGKK